MSKFFLLISHPCSKARYIVLKYIFWAMVFLYSFRFCSVFVCEGYISSIPVFTFSFAFSGFHKCHSFVLLRKNMSSQITASSFFVILSLNWISFNSAFCLMWGPFLIYEWQYDIFWYLKLMDWFQHPISQLFLFLGFHDCLAGVHFEVTSSEWWLEGKFF